MEKGLKRTEEFIETRVEGIDAQSNEGIISEYTKGKICNILLPGHLLLGTKLGDWYEKNPYHKFNEGDILILKGNAFGYGIRPVAIVNGYIMEDQFGEKVGRYNITMYGDDNGNFMKWINENWIPEGVNRKSNKGEIHFKWNIENQFKKVNVKSPEEALLLYAA